nr:hypothetical protein [Tanacetum cinerariifolium]
KVSDSNPFEVLNSVDNDVEMGTNGGFIDGQAILVDEVDNPLKRTGFGTQSLLEQWRDSYGNDDYDKDLYDDDMYEGTLGGKYGLVRSMFSSSTRLFSFQFSSMDGLDAKLENGSWFIRNNPLILKKWHPDVNLLKEDVSTVPVWVKLYGVPVTAFSGDGLSVIATKLELKDNIVVAMPKITREGHYKCNIHVEYERKPLRKFKSIVIDGQAILVDEVDNPLKRFKTKVNPSASYLANPILTMRSQNASQKQVLEFNILSVVAQDLEIFNMKAMIKFIKDIDGGRAEPSGEDALIKGRSLETGDEAGIERSTEKGSNDTEELVNVLTSIDAANILTSRVQAVSVPPAAEVSTVGILTGSGMVPTASPIFTTTSVVTPYLRHKGKEKMVKSDTPKKKKLQEQIDV